MIKVHDRDGIYLDKVEPSKWADGRPDRVWITRDSDDEAGELSSVCEVWSSRPERCLGKDLDGECRGVMWLDADGTATLLGRYSVAAIKHWIGGACPDNDRECVVKVL